MSQFITCCKSFRYSGTLLNFSFGWVLEDSLAAGDSLLSCIHIYLSENLDFRYLKTLVDHGFVCACCMPIRDLRVCDICRNIGPTFLSLNS